MPSCPTIKQGGPLGLQGPRRRNGLFAMKALGGGNLLTDRDYCAVVVTHNLAIADAADKVWRMADGVLSEQETA